MAASFISTASTAGGPVAIFSLEDDSLSWEGFADFRRDMLAYGNGSILQSLQEQRINGLVLHHGSDGEFSVFANDESFIVLIVDYTIDAAPITTLPDDFAEKIAREPTLAFHQFGNRVLVFDCDLPIDSVDWYDQATGAMRSGSNASDSTLDRISIDGVLLRIADGSWSIFEVHHEDDGSSYDGVFACRNQPN